MLWSRNDPHSVVGMPVAIFERQFGNVGFEVAEAFIAVRSTQSRCEGIPYVRVFQPALHYEREQISTSEILRKLKQRFGGKTDREIRLCVG
jgi:hypothetical protein